MQCRISSRTSDVEDGDAVGDPAMMTYSSGTEEGCRRAVDEERSCGTGFDSYESRQPMKNL